MRQEPVFPSSPLERVREGMTVVDESGRRLGTVARLRLGDPQAVTTRGEAPAVGDAGVIAAPATGTGGALGVGVAAPLLGDHPFGPDVPDQLTRDLLRAGFVEVDGPDLRGPARYVPGDRISEVTAETVRLGPDPAATTAPPPPEPRGSTIGEPVLRTYLGPPREPGPSLSMPVFLGSAVLVSGAAVGWFVWRRRRAQRTPLQRARRAGQHLAHAAANRRDLAGSIAAALALAVFVLSRVQQSRSAEGRPVQSSC